MNQTSRDTLSQRPFRFVLQLCLIVQLCLFGATSQAQEEADQASMSSSIAGDGTGTIVVEARGQLPKPPVFYTASTNTNVQVGSKQIEQTIELIAKVVQGDAKMISLGIVGDDQVLNVQGENLQSWAVRREGTERFLDLHVKEKTTELTVQVQTRSDEFDLQKPVSMNLTHITPGKAIGFNSLVTLRFSAGVDGTVTDATGFAPLDSDGKVNRFQTATGGQISLSLRRASSAPGPVELSETSLEGELHGNGDSIHFRLSGTAQVTEPNAEITILSGHVAVSEIPKEAKFRLTLSMPNDQPVYKLVFAEPGTFSVSLDFVAALSSSPSGGRSMNFTVAAGAVVPMTLNGLKSDLEFHRDQTSVVPILEENRWIGFLPATGQAKLHWKAARQTGEGKLFFSTTGQVDAQVGAGLLRQSHMIDYQVLQGELKSYSILLQGPGEILDVQGSNVVSWEINAQDDDRLLSVTLSQPVTGTSQVSIRSQTPLGAFPVRIDGLRLNPEGAIRHSGYLRLTNSGSVRLEPASLSGLTQLAPEQFPGAAIEARQVFVYRFPTANHAFTVAADRIEPEVNVSELVSYEFGETDRVIQADIELDIREASIREWDFGIPEDYSIVSVTGTNVADYIAASTVANGRRNLKVVFGQDVLGRQLVSLNLEKSIAAAAGEWELQPITYVEAKSVRGAIGIVGAPGYRITIGQTDLLVEKPLSYFPKPSPHLQQAFRIREPGWSATMQVELLDRSVQADVFHLYSLSQETIYGSALINFFVTGAPISEWNVTVPETLENLMIDGQDVRTWRRDGNLLTVYLHQPVMGAYTLLVTFEEKSDDDDGTFQAGQIAPSDVQGERGFIQVVSPMQIKIDTESISNDMLQLDPLELPAEFRLLSTAPPLGTWQYTDRPFDLNLKVNWFEPGSTLSQVVEFSEVNSRVSQDGELVTDVLYYVKSRGRGALKVKIPDEPVRLWAVSVNGQPVTARQTEDATLIPLPGATDPNIPVEVRLRLGKPAVKATQSDLQLPVVFAPVLKTQWNIAGDEKHVLVPAGGTVTPPEPVVRQSGFAWVARRGFLPLFAIAALSAIGFWLRDKTRLLWRLFGVLSLAAAIFLSCQVAMVAHAQAGSHAPLQLDLPILSTAEPVEIRVNITPLWRVDLSWIGLTGILAGLVSIVWPFYRPSARDLQLRSAGAFLVALGVLLQGGGAPWFFALLALAILVLLFAQPAVGTMKETFNGIQQFLANRKARKEANKNKPATAETGAVATMIAVAALLLSSFGHSFAADSADFAAADSIKQSWQVTHEDSRLKASGTIEVTGRPGDQFALLRVPAILTKFEGEGLLLTKREIPQDGITYIVSIPAGNNGENSEAPPIALSAKFEYLVEAINPTKGLPVLTGSAAIQEIDLNYDETGWSVTSATAVRIEQSAAEMESTQAKILLGPGRSSLALKPMARDVTTEQTRFFVEASNLFLTSPGVVDGVHRLNIRTSQGQVSELNVLVPKGLMVSSVEGPVGFWQFNAETGMLKVEVDPAQRQTFSILVKTQRGLDPLPTDVNLAPLRIVDADGEVGLVAIAFGPDAQPESVEARVMSAVNLGDFDSSLMPNQQAVLHRVFRYGADGGDLDLRIAPVGSEVRVFSKQVLSLGDERVVLAVNFAVEITRAGLFQLSFPLPDGFEVESLTGPALHHWTELTEDGARQINLHLNGKTLGKQTFSLTLTGASPAEIGQWEIPRFELNEADRQTGELVIRPTTGIRLRTDSRQNVSETDPRTIGGGAQGALAFRLLQRDWNLVLDIEKLDPWVTGQVLHDMTLREGQTRSSVIANLIVQNASIRSLRIVIPDISEEEINTLRATGSIVSDLVKTAPDSNIWEVLFKRNIVGKLEFRLEYERRGDRETEEETLVPIQFPQARQISYFYGVRAGGRLELEHGTLTKGWQRVDWNSVPKSLREEENRTTPAITLRAVSPDSGLKISGQRHELADALKLRVAQGALTTLLSPTGDQLTAVDVVIEVIQRSSLIVGLPTDGELFSIFVNDESVNSIRHEQDNSWQFYILPGIDDRTAQVRFLYSVKGEKLSNLKLTSPQLNVPLENIQWKVIAPKGFELNDNDGNLELVSQTSQQEFDRSSYLSVVSGTRQSQAQQATELLQQANELLQAGEQSKASWALKSVANQYALDAASNEDARVQLENLQTQQAIVGLNTRRQRLYLDNSRDGADITENNELRQAAADNPVLQQGQTNFRPQQLSQLLRGNTMEDNAILQRIAGRLVRHQRGSDTAPQAIIISVPEEGDVYTFGRVVQVAENAPLDLDLEFGSKLKLKLWQTLLTLAMLSGLAALLAFGSHTVRRDDDESVPEEVAIE